MNRKPWPYTLGLALTVWLTFPFPGWGAERERFQFRTGVTYDQGDFGTDVTSHTFVVPFSFRYLGDQFDLGLTIPIVYQDSSQAVTIVDGEPERIREGGLAEILKDLAPGVGDLFFKGRFYLFDDPGLASPLPGVTPFAKVKFPTADEDEGLGTGKFDYGFGLEFDKQINDLFLFADAGYTFIGEPPGTNLRDRISAGGGIGYDLIRNLSASVSLAWRRSLVSGADDPVDVFVDASWRITRTFTWTPFVSFGLTDGSSDFGVGFGISYRFGRF